jgi:hypothetical protein
MIMTTRKESSMRNDERLPAVGTVIKKLDRNGMVRARCTVAEHGIRYKGQVYETLSAAAGAAAHDLGLRATSYNGFAFWGLSTPARPTPLDPEAVEQKINELSVGMDSSLGIRMVHLLAEKIAIASYNAGLTRALLLIGDHRDTLPVAAKVGHIDKGAVKSLRKELDQLTADLKRSWRTY